MTVSNTIRAKKKERKNELEDGNSNLKHLSKTKQNGCNSNRYQSQQELSQKQTRRCGSQS